MERFPKGMIFSGTVLMGMTLALGWGGLQIIIKGEIGKQMRLINGTDTYKAWLRVPIPVYISIYLFNLTNPDEFANGGKPIVAETGPYVYRETLHKDATEDNVINETLRYRQQRTYLFQPGMSKGSEDDFIVQVNEPLVATAKILTEQIQDASIIEQADAWLAEKGEKVTMGRSVHEWLLGEYSVQNYVDLANESMITSAGDGNFKLYDQFEDGSYSVLELVRKNGTDDSPSPDGEWLVMTGRNKSAHFGKVVGWNDNEELLAIYKADSCNAINGTDGFIFHPFLKESTPMFIFSSEMCRSVQLLRGDRSMLDNIEFYRYHMDPNALMGPQKNPDNWCFCTKEDAASCDVRNGVHQLDACWGGFPRSVSLPHFMGADEETISAVGGMKPEMEMHHTYLDVHPLSGIVLKSSKRLQYNLETMPYSKMPSVSKLPKVTLPLFWMDETLDAHHSDVLMLSIIKTIENIWDNIRWGFIAIGGVLVFVGIATALTRRSSIKSESVTLIQ